MVDEFERLARVYRGYTSGRWAVGNRGNRLIVAELLEQTKRLLHRNGLLPLQGRVLDVGCGSGWFLQSMRELGAAELHGIDLLPDSIQAARSAHPDLDFRVGNAEHLPYPDGSFGLVVVVTVFTSILDNRIRANVASEISRVLHNDGSVFWYDFRYNNPWNPHVRAVSRREIKQLFPGFAVDLRSVTLVPQLARRLGPVTPVLYRLLAAVPLLRTHYLGLLRRPHSKQNRYDS